MFKAAEINGGINNRSRYNVNGCGSVNRDKRREQEAKSWEITHTFIAE